MFIRFVSLALCFCFATSCQAQAVTLENVQEVATAAEETQVREALTKQIEVAVREKDFKLLSSMERDFLANRTQTQSGIWKLELFYASVYFYLKDGLEAADNCQYANADFVAQWTAAEPKSPAPIIANAELLTEQAWCYRGRGSSSTVSSDGRDKFYRGLDNALDTMESNKAVASVDPHFYAVQTTIYRGMGASEAQFQALLKEATDREPDYPRTYMNAVWYYMPQWHGSFEAVDQFARYAAEKSKRTNGTGMYARVLWSLESCKCKILEVAADWEILKQSMQDVYVRYPVGWNREYFTKASLIMHQPQEAYDYIKRAHPGLSEMETRDLLLKANSDAILNR